MERDSYDEFIEDDETDLAMAANRYTDELHRLAETINRYYPQLGTVESTIGNVITPFTVDNYYSSSLNDTAYTSINEGQQLERDIIEIKRTISYIQEDVAGIKRMLSNTAEKINSLAHRKITL